MIYMEDKEKKQADLEVEKSTDSKPNESQSNVDMEEVERLANELAVELTNKAVQSRIAQLTKKHEIEKEKAVADALKKAEMTTEELAQDAFNELQGKYDALLDKYNSTVNGGIVKDKLAEAGLPITETLVKSLIADMDNVDEAIKDLKSNFDTEIQKQVDDRLKSSTVDFKKQSDSDSKTKPIYRNTASRIGVQ